jgi:3-hydroxyisobutyrate dehydrogenase
VAIPRKISAAFAEKCLYMLDSPVRRALGDGERQDGDLGPAATSRSSTVLDAMADQAAYIDPIGAGTIAKLVHNCTGAMMA